jgi:uncharacterized protein (DUF433 family)
MPPQPAGVRDNHDVTQAIARDPDIMHGVLVFPGTRVPVQTLSDYLAGGDGLDDFLEGFPTFTRAMAALLPYSRAGSLVCLTCGMLSGNLKHWKEYAKRYVAYLDALDRCLIDHCGCMAGLRTFHKELFSPASQTQVSV